VLLKPRSVKTTRWNVLPAHDQLDKTSSLESPGNNNTQHCTGVNKIGTVESSSYRNGKDTLFIDVVKVTAVQSVNNRKKQPVHLHRYGETRHAMYI
jgi:hypothetical protein